MNSAIYSQLIEAIKLIELNLASATPSQIFPILAMLRIHFPIKDISDEAINILMKDYMNELSLYPIDIIQYAYLEYCRNESSIYFPKIGQLLGLIKKRWYQRKYKLQKLRRLLEVSHQYQHKK